ncbi:MAG: hypothetical protein HOO91_05380 [Bacteroidales bacterium]|nr:hypothetical protein [Bacteroidales bacterium]
MKLSTYILRCNLNKSSIQMVYGHNKGFYSCTSFINTLLFGIKAEELQGNAMFTRKSKTMDKNIFQRAVEDEVSKISALGQHVFLNKDATVAKLFEYLIPSPNKIKAENPIKNKINPQESVTV